MFRIREIDHVVIRVADPERMEAFYREVLGCTVERRQPEIGMVQLRAGRSLVDLLDARGPLGREGGDPPGELGRNMHHLCFRVEPFDGEAIRAIMVDRGLNPGRLSVRFGAEGYGPSLYLDDPEGNTVELKGPSELP